MFNANPTFSPGLADAKTRYLTKMIGKVMYAGAAAMLKSNKGWFMLLTLIVAGCSRGDSSKPNVNGGGLANVEIINVSYDPTRELHEEINRAFTAEHLSSTGQRVIVRQSHG